MGFQKAQDKRTWQWHFPKKWDLPDANRPNQGKPRQRHKCSIRPGFRPGVFL
jgi:hypothetical protein